MSSAQRLFVGLPLPGDLGEAVFAGSVDWRARAPGLRWVEPDLFHFTLKFLGDTDPSLIPELQAALARVEAPSPFPIRPGAAIGLPAGRRARVLALDLAEGLPELRSLAEAVESACTGVGFPAESRPFRAHLTLARAGRGASGSLDPLQPIEGLAAPACPAGTAGEFRLYRSHLRPGGPIYETLAVLPL